MMNNSKNLTALSSLSLALFVSYALIQSPSLPGADGRTKGRGQGPRSARAAAEVSLRRYQ